MNHCCCLTVHFYSIRIWEALCWNYAVEALQLRETCILVACVIKELVRKRCIFHGFYSGSEKINESRYSSFPSTFSCSKAYFCFVHCHVGLPFFTLEEEFPAHQSILPISWACVSSVSSISMAFVSGWCWGWISINVVGYHFLLWVQQT